MHLDSRECFLLYFCMLCLQARVENEDVDCLKQSCQVHELCDFYMRQIYNIIENMGQNDRDEFNIF